MLFRLRYNIDGLGTRLFHVKCIDNEYNPIVFMLNEYHYVSLIKSDLPRLSKLAARYTTCVNPSDVYANKF